MGEPDNEEPINADMCGKRILSYSLPRHIELCKSPRSDTPHTCPYKVEVGGDTRDLCFCCEQCEHDCFMDV